MVRMGPYDEPQCLSVSHHSSKVRFGSCFWDLHRLGKEKMWCNLLGWRDALALISLLPHLTPCKLHQQWKGECDLSERNWGKRRERKKREMFHFIWALHLLCLFLSVIRLIIVAIIICSCILLLLSITCSTRYFFSPFLPCEKWRAASLIKFAFPLASSPISHEGLSSY